MLKRPQRYDYSTNSCTHTWMQSIHPWPVETEVIVIGDSGAKAARGVHTHTHTHIALKHTHALITPNTNLGGKNNIHPVLVETKVVVIGDGGAEAARGVHWRARHWHAHKVQAQNGQTCVRLTLATASIHIYPRTQACIIAPLYYQMYAVWVIIPHHCGYLTTWWVCWN